MVGQVKYHFCITAVGHVDNTKSLLLLLNSFMPRGELTQEYFKELCEKGGEYELLHPEGTDIVKVSIRKFKKGEENGT